MIRTADMGVGDLGLTDWCIIDLKAVNKPERFDRHMFGFCEETGVFQISSKILEETDEYVETRSRKYFKGGPECRNLDLRAAANLADFLLWGWRLELDQVREVMTQVTKFGLTDEGDIHFPSSHTTQDGIVIPHGDPELGLDEDRLPPASTVPNELLQVITANNEEFQKSFVTAEQLLKDIYNKPEAREEW